VAHLIWPGAGSQDGDDAAGEGPGGGYCVDLAELAGDDPESLSAPVKWPWLDALVQADSAVTLGYQGQKLTDLARRVDRVLEEPRSAADALKRIPVDHNPARPARSSGDGLPREPPATVVGDGS
jgi:hypothetical protein